MKLIKLTDYIALFLKQHGFKDVFGVTGGASVHFFDSFKKKNMNLYFNHHEQASAFCLNSYFKASKKPAICAFTTGPGSTNTITGLAACWQDSIPGIFIGGQARSNQLSIRTGTRQVGTQEINSLNIVKSITKYSAILDNPKKIKKILQEAIYFSKKGRGGPSWIEIPLDFQLKYIDISKLKDSPIMNKDKKKKYDLSTAKIKFSKLLQKAKNPLVIAGNGIISSDSEEKFKKFINYYNLPYVCTWLGTNLELISKDLYCGRLGMAGQRGSNIIVDKSDLLIVLGSHLPASQTGVNFDLFSKKSKKIIINIDQKEIKNSKLNFDLFINCDLKEFFDQFKFIKENKKKQKTNFLKNIQKLNKVDSSHKIIKNKNYINQYIFLDYLNTYSKGNESYVIDGGGTNVYISYQALKLKKKQKIFHSSTICSMGSGLPESIGASVATKKKIICLIGDGSLMFNLQELETIKKNKMDIKIIVFNNDGYVSIRDTQRQFLNKLFLGSSVSGNLSVTNIKKISKAFGLKHSLIKNYDNIAKKIIRFLDDKGPNILEVKINPNQQLAPKQGFIKEKVNGISKSNSLADMYPFIKMNI